MPKMKKKKKGKHAHHHKREHAAAGELHRALAHAYEEQKTKAPKAALAFAALSEVVPPLAKAVPNWSHDPGLTRRFFHKEGH